MEHRCGYRRAVNVPVIVRTSGGLVGKARLAEVSASGARLVTSLPLIPETLVSLRMELHDGERRERLTLEAEVVRRTESGFGLEWTDFAPEAARCLFAPADAALETLAAEALYRRVGGR